MWTKIEFVHFIRVKTSASSTSTFSPFLLHPRNFIFQVTFNSDAAMPNINSVKNDINVRLYTHIRYSKLENIYIIQIDKKKGSSTITEWSCRLLEYVPNYSIFDMLSAPPPLAFIRKLQMRRKNGEPNKMGRHTFYSLAHQIRTQMLYFPLCMSLAT